MQGVIQIERRINGLAESSPVEVNGFKVGVVQSINFIDAESGKLLAIFSVNKNFKIPKNSVAEIVPVSLLGGMKVQLVYGNLITELDSVISSVKDIMNPDFKKDLGGILSNLHSTTGSLDKIVGSKEEELKSAVDNINKFSLMLSTNSDNMNKTFSNLRSVTDTLAAADIYNSVNNLKALLEKTALLLDNLNNGKGSAGQFLTNDTLYTNLTKSLESLNLLLLDLKANPKRYVHFSLFGKKSSSSE